MTDDQYDDNEDGYAQAMRAGISDLNVLESLEATVRTYDSDAADHISYAVSELMGYRQARQLIRTYWLRVDGGGWTDETEDESGEDVTGQFLQIIKDFVERS
jgi:hypothetical protein